MFWVMTQSNRPSALQIGDRLMGGIGPGVLEEIAGEEEAPLLPAGLRARQELVDREILRIEFCPEAAGTAEIGDPGFGADARPREDDDASRLPDHLRDPADLLFPIPVRSFRPPDAPARLEAGRPNYSRTPPKIQNEIPLPAPPGDPRSSFGAVRTTLKSDIFLTHRGPFAYMCQKRSSFEFSRTPRPTGRPSRREER